jgi:hypothetical protein
VNIIDPDARCQIVGLHPAQNVKLRLTKQRWAHPTVHAHSKYLQCRMSEDSKYIDYDIEQTPLAQGKNSCSTFFLGQVQVGRDSSLILYQNNDTTPYKNTITVVSPMYESVRIKPFQFLEVVLVTDGMPTFENKWDWRWIPGKDHVGMEEIGYRFIYSAYLQNNNVECYPFNMMEHSQDGNAMQHHFWFRCEREVLSLLPNCERGLYLGQLNFRRRQVAGDACVNVYIDVHQRYKEETEQAMRDVQYRMVAMPQRPQFHGPVCRSISLHEIEFKNLDDGCKTVGGEDDAGVQGETDHNLSHH